LPFAGVAIKNPLFPRAPAPGTDIGLQGNRDHSRPLAGEADQVAAHSAGAAAMLASDHRGNDPYEALAAAHGAARGAAVLGIGPAAAAIGADHLIHEAFPTAGLAGHWAEPVQNLPGVFHGPLTFL